MKWFEKISIALRRSPVLAGAVPVWRLVRPIYRGALGLSKRGLERNINGTDTIQIIPELYTLSENYEPEVWKLVFQEVRAGDVVADVGASIGLYTIALGKRVGPEGTVHAFEPDLLSRNRLEQHVSLNKLTSRVQVHNCVVGDRDGSIYFAGGSGVESHVSPDPSDGTVEVESVTLDTVFQDKRLDLLKIDVEGFELRVLEGATSLLSDARRGPRSIFIEVHPFAWEGLGVDGDSLLLLLARYGYSVTTLSGEPVQSPMEYGEIVAKLEGSIAELGRREDDRVVASTY